MLIVLSWQIKLIVLAKYGFFLDVYFLMDSETSFLRRKTSAAARSIDHMNREVLVCKQFQVSHKAMLCITFHSKNTAGMAIRSSHLLYSQNICKTFTKAVLRNST